MDPERVQQMRQTFEAALTLPAEQRAAFFEALGRGDAELQSAVQRLLAAHEKPTELINRAAFPIRTDAGEMNPGDVDHADGLVGRRIGAYEVVRRLGRGGMGEVYLARRADEVFDARVALKVVR